MTGEVRRTFPTVFELALAPLEPEPIGEVEGKLLDLIEKVMMEHDSVSSDSYLTLYEISSDVCRVETENAKLRELVRDWRALAVDGADSLPDWNARQADLESRMGDLGMEVSHE